MAVDQPSRLGLDFRLDIAGKDRRRRRQRSPRPQAVAARRSGRPPRRRRSRQSRGSPARRRADRAAWPSPPGIAGCSSIGGDAQRLDRRVERKPHARRIGLGELPWFGGGEIAVRFGDDLEHGAEIEWSAKARMCRRASPISASARARIARSAAAGSASRQSGTAPPQFLAIIDSERCARLPRSLARSAFMRWTIASCE